ncbi:MAG: hypothetical protein U0636_12220 [Phycisphaerales bacterium]
MLFTQSAHARLQDAPPEPQQPANDPPASDEPAADPAAEPAAAPQSEPAAAPAAAPFQPKSEPPIAEPGNEDVPVFGPPSPNAQPAKADKPLPEPAKPEQPAAAPPPALPASVPEPVINAKGNWTFSAENCEISLALQAIAKARRMNLVMSPGVATAGVVSFRVYDLPFEQAFDAVLKAAGCVAYTEGNVTLVHTVAEEQKTKADAVKAADDQRKREDDQRKREDDQRKRDADAAKTAAQADQVMEPRIYTLQFLSATDAEAIIKPILTTDLGKVVPLGGVKAGYEPTLEDGGADTYAFTAKVMVFDTPAKQEQVAALIKDLDTAPKQVRVEATILTADLTDDTAFGLDISVVGNIDFASVAAPLAAFDNVFDGSVKPNPTATANASSLYPATKGQPNPTLKMGVITNDVAIFLQMLDQVVDSTVLARPTVTVLNRQKANVLVGERIAYLSTTQTQTSTTQEVKYLDVGVKLRFRPFVSPDGMVRLELAPEVSSARIKDIDAAGGGKATVPDELAQSLKTNVRVKSGQTIVLGGLFREITDTTNRQIPILGDIVPGAFSGAASQVKKQEIIFLITPTVIEDAQSYEQGEKEMKLVDAAKVGSRAGLLPFSQSHLMGAYEVQALEAWKKGDRSTALYWVDQALRMEKYAPSMLTLREAIRTDNKEQWQTSLDSLILLPPPILQDSGGKSPPTIEDLSKDVPPPVDDDFTRVPPRPMQNIP